MPALRYGSVVEVLEQRAGLMRVKVALGDPPKGETIVASCYTDELGPLSPGDRVLVNTTGLDLDLGTGGEGFVAWAFDAGDTEVGEGHIVKLRYTPWQTNVLAAEAPESEHHSALAEAADLA